MKRFFCNQGRNNEELESGLKRPCWWGSSCQGNESKSHEPKESPCYKAGNKLADISRDQLLKGKGVVSGEKYQAVYAAWVGHPSLIC